MTAENYTKEWHKRVTQSDTRKFSQRTRIFARTPVAPVASVAPNINSVEANNYSKNMIQLDILGLAVTENPTDITHGRWISFFKYSISYDMLLRIPKLGKVIGPLELGTGSHSRSPSPSLIPPSPLSQKFQRDKTCPIKIVHGLPYYYYVRLSLFNQFSGKES